LLDGESADGKIDGSTAGKQQQSFQERRRVFAAGKGYRYTVAFADHLEALYGFTDFAQKCLFEFHLIRL
jgi:hypothetical protein